MYNFKDKSVLVTGGSFGIGKSTAIAFAKAGAKVMIADWMDGTEVINIIRRDGGTVEFQRCDVSDLSQVKGLFSVIQKKFGGLDFAFNNAGIEGLMGTTAECTDENWDKTIGVNLKGIWYCMREEIPLMLKAGKGAIVNCASIAGLVGYPGLPAYVASKHGVVGLTKTASLDCSRQNIRVNAVCPGAIKTPMIDRLTGNKKEVEQQYAEMEPMGRLGDPDEVANAVLWLCSDESSFVTGHAMAIDGGWTAR
jgi:NAD(P)-dependent dehydrogenase (short-subunit alcohol dehydrogenase family)